MSRDETPLDSLDGVANPDVRIRLSAERHVTGILQIQNREDYRAFIGQWSIAKLHEALTDPSVEVVVATDALDTVLGFYLLCDLVNKDRSLNLLRLAVALPGAGVGGRLLRCAQRRAFAEHGAHRLWLDVFTTNTQAEALYRRYGWVEEGVLRDSHWRDGRFHSQRIMSMLDNEWRERYR